MNQHANQTDTAEPRPFVFMTSTVALGVAAAMLATVAWDPGIQIQTIPTQKNTCSCIRISLLKCVAYHPGRSEQSESQGKKYPCQLRCWRSYLGFAFSIDKSCSKSSLPYPETYPPQSLGSLVSWVVAASLDKAPANFLLFFFLGGGGSKLKLWLRRCFGHFLSYLLKRIVFWIEILS